MVLVIISIHSLFYRGSVEGYGDINGDSIIMVTVMVTIVFAVDIVVVVMI